MTITRMLGVAIAAGLLLAISKTSSGACQSRHLSGAHAQASVKEDRGVASYPSRVPAFDPRGTSAIRLARGSTSLIRTMSALPPIPDNMTEDIESLCRPLVWNVLGP